jgi:hypothetical protein
MELARTSFGDGHYNEQILLSIIITRVSKLETIAVMVVESLSMEWCHDIGKFVNLSDPN